MLSVIIYCICSKCSIKLIVYHTHNIHCGKHAADLETSWTSTYDTNFIIDGDGYICLAIAWITTIGYTSKSWKAERLKGLWYCMLVAQLQGHIGLHCGSQPVNLGVGQLWMVPSLIVAPGGPYPKSVIPHVHLPLRGGEKASQIMFGLRRHEYKQSNWIPSQIQDPSKLKRSWQVQQVRFNLLPVPPTLQEIIYI